MQNVVIDHGVASGWKASVFQLDQSFISVFTTVKSEINVI